MAAQQPDTTRGRPDTTAVGDSLVDAFAGLRDDAAVDSTGIRTVDYLAAQRAARQRIALPPLLGADGPRPPGSRLVFTRDSLDWALALTVGDLLMQVPGVYVWRGGWVGRPEPATMHARGAAASAEYWVDGVPFVPMGVDSVGVDAGLFPLRLLERVEVDRWPGFVRVRLYSLRHDRVAARSTLGFGRGQGGLSRYQGTLERDIAPGTYLAVGADYLNVPTSAASPRFNDTRWLARVAWMPTPTRGLVVQYAAFSPDVGAVGSVPPEVSLGYAGGRGDLSARGHLRQRPDGQGLGLDVHLMRTSWTSDSGATPEIDQQLLTAAAVASWRQPTAFAEVGAWWRSRWTPLTVRAEGWWSPLGRVSLGGEGTFARHGGGRQSAWVALRLGVPLPLGLHATGSARLGELVQAPAVEGDSAQRLADFGGFVGFDRPRLGGEVGLEQTASWRPTGFTAYPFIAEVSPTGGATWVTARGRLAPVQWLTFDGWFSTPRPFAPEGQPPTHSVVRGTIRSRFWRVFPSGALDLKLQGAVENWYPGVIGRTVDGDPLELPRTTFFRMSLQMKLTNLTVTLDQSNLAGTRVEYVPGLPIPTYAWSLGLRWEFSN